jgi:hypothetical protein
MIGNGGIGGFIDNGGGTGRVRECILEVGDVERREGTEIGLIGGRESCGEVYEDAGSGGIGGGGSSCDAPFGLCVRGL